MKEALTLLAAVVLLAACEEQYRDGSNVVDMADATVSAAPSESDGHDQDLDQDQEQSRQGQ